MKNKIIKIKVKPNSGEQEIVENENSDGYVVNLKSAPENNKANTELIKLLEKYFKKKIKIKSGFTSRNKLIEVQEDEI